MKKDNKFLTEGEIEIFLKALSSIPQNESIQYGNIQIIRSSIQDFKVIVTDEIVDYGISTYADQSRQEELKKFLEGM